jgi:hypothetical protein
MATYDYLKTGEALARAYESARDFEKIVGLRGIDADQLRPRIDRTRAGYMRKPEDPWRAYGDREKFREIVSVMRTEGDADSGTITVTFRNGDGTEESTYLHAGDLLCVERPV